MKLSKKGQGLSMNVIIIAAIALIVLVVLAVLLFGASSDVTESKGCEAGIYSGDCKPVCGDGELRLLGASCPGEEVCCRPL
jgi:hypothetical protein